MCYSVTSVLLYEIKQCKYQLCVNLYELAILETNYIPYQRSVSQLSDDMLNITLGYWDKQTLLITFKQELYSAWPSTKNSTLSR